MPACESGEDESDDATENGEKDGVHYSHSFFHLGLFCDFHPYPPGTDTKTRPTEDGRVNEEEQERLVVPQPGTSRQPGTVMIHLQNAFPARRAVMRTIRLDAAAFLAISRLARLLCRHSRHALRKLRLVILIRRQAFISTSFSPSGCIAPRVEW